MKPNSTDPVAKPTGASLPGLPLPLPLQPFVGEYRVFTVPPEAPFCDDVAFGSHCVIHAANILQDAGDSRGLLRAWFALLPVGGRLLIEVPHTFLCERELALPSRTHPGRRRLYSPAMLLDELEEALVPNTYRLRMLCDHDDDYDYASSDKRSGQQSILAVIERIERPEWELDTGELSRGVPANVSSESGRFEPVSFEPPRTRHEHVALAPRHRVIILKLDHLGDFIMGLPALEKARTVFADAEITLVVGNWNVAMARDLGLFDHVIAFDAFPRNSSEEKVDLAARIANFETTFPGIYDLAIDLRTDPDTRVFLNHLRAGLRAGIGTRAQFPFLDIFLPIDLSRMFEGAAEKKLEVHDHIALAPCRKTHHRLSYDARKPVPAGQCLVYGPYAQLTPGDYVFIPDIEIDDDGDRVLCLDIACDEISGLRLLATQDQKPQFPFCVEHPGARFEFRIHAMTDRRTPSFSYFGGRLLRRGASSVLHQSEYLALLIDLISMRVDQFGVLTEMGGSS